MRKLWYIFSWIPVGIFHIATMLAGLVIVPVAIHLSEGKKEQWPDLFWLWGNDEEFVPEWWLIRARTLEYYDDDKWYEKVNIWLIKKFPRFWWFAVRNPVNNFRYIFKDRIATYDTNWDQTIPMEAPQMLAKGQQMAYRWAYNGVFAGYRRVWLTGTDGDGSYPKYSEIWVGWKVGSTVPGMGFTTQYRPNVEIGE